MARSGQGGESMQGLPVSRGGRRLLLVDTVPALDHLRQPLMTEVNRCDRFKEQSHSEQTAIILSLSCTNPSILKHLSSMWCARFGVQVLTK